MDPKVLKLLNSKLEERRQELIEFLGDGGAKSYDHYKEVCGVLRGLLTAQSEINDLLQKMKEYEDE
jgi:hypothetical protein